MNQDTQALRPQAVLLWHIADAARQGDVEAVRGHLLVYQAIVSWIEKNA